MKTYWITGASSGIGSALATSLAQSGNNIIISGRKNSDLIKLKENCPNPEAVKIVCFDQSSITQCEDAVKCALELFPKIDCVILNAGISQRSLAKDTKLDVYQNLINVNYLGTICIAQGLIAQFIKQGSGQFVVISSLLGKFGTPYRSGYAASKHALHGYFDSLRAEFMAASQNIDVTIICPGFVNTNIAFNALNNLGEMNSTHDESTRNGMSTHKFAMKAIKAINKRKMEVIIAGKEGFGVSLKKYFPKTFARMISKAKVT
jgi:dehydrogenase/reductase SDR family member 7